MRVREYSCRFVGEFLLIYWEGLHEKIHQCWTTTLSSILALFQVLSLSLLLNFQSHWCSLHNQQCLALSWVFREHTSKFTCFIICIFGWWLSCLHYGWTVCAWGGYLHDTSFKVFHAYTRKTSCFPCHAGKIWYYWCLTIWAVFIGVVAIFLVQCQSWCYAVYKAVCFSCSSKSWLAWG